MKTQKLTTVLIVSGFALLLTSCAGIYKFLGFTPNQVKDQLAKDQAAAADIIDTAREQLWQLATAAVTAAGAIASGFLGRKLSTERKITTALITGIESSDSTDLKKIITAKATSAGIEPALNKRVRAIT